MLERVWRKGKTLLHCWWECGLIPMLWPPDAKSWLIGKDPDAGRDWEQEEKEMTEDERAGWHHWLYGHEFGWTPGVGDGQGGLAWCDSWGHKELDTTEGLNWTTIESLFDFLIVWTNRFQQSKVKNHELKSSPPKDWVKISVKPSLFFIILLNPEIILTFISAPPPILNVFKMGKS